MDWLVILLLFSQLEPAAATNLEGMYVSTYNNASWNIISRKNIYQLHCSSLNPKEMPMRIPGLVSCDLSLLTIMLQNGRTHQSSKYKVPNISNKKDKTEAEFLTFFWDKFCSYLCFLVSWIWKWCSFLLQKKKNAWKHYD